LESAQRKPRSEILEVIEKVIKKAYAQVMDTKFRSEWRRIVGWVDSELVRDVEPHTLNEAEWAKVRQDSETCLNFLSNWYKKIYIPEDVVAFMDVAISHEFPGITVAGTIPIIRAFEEPVILVISDIVHTEWSLYNDISIRGLAWLASKSIEADRIHIESISPGKQGGFNHARVGVDKTSCKRAGKMIEEIATQLVLGADYPSVTSSCESCPFKRRCAI
jgi:hypothetical protein